MPTLLIIDDERNVAYSLEKGLKKDGLTIHTAATAREGLNLITQVRPDAILLDIQLPDMSGLDVLDKIRAADRKVPVIVITAHGTAETAIEAMKRGAYDYVLKPWRLAELRELVERALESARLSRVPAVFDHERMQTVEGADPIVGRSLAIQTVFKEIGRVAAQDVNVLILGESGTGKELIARAIYHHSQRNNLPFLAINCAAIPETLLESELFGHEKGSFTGADRRRIGKFEQAHGGTLFLDEIGDMSSATQAKVLRVLQDGRFERVGGGETIQADVRIIAATNKNLEEAIRRKEFRQDLFYRLNTFTLTLPPLRERWEDIPLLAEHFLRRDRMKLSIDVQGIAPNVMKALLDHKWPGNIRELESTIRYAIVHATGSTLALEDLPASVFGEHSYRPATPSAIDGSAFEQKPVEALSDVRQLVKSLLSAGAADLHDQVHAAVDRVLIEEVLNHCDGHQTKAAEILGISRTTLRTRMQQLELVVEKAVQIKDAEESN